MMAPAIDPMTTDGAAPGSPVVEIDVGAAGEGAFAAATVAVGTTAVGAPGVAVGDIGPTVAVAAGVPAVADAVDAAGDGVLLAPLEPPQAATSSASATNSTVGLSLNSIYATSRSG
jgi:hypothetical protein